MQQIYRRTPMRKCDFNKVALQLYWNHISALAFSCKCAAYFQNTFSPEHPWVTASVLRSLDTSKDQIIADFLFFLVTFVLEEGHQFVNVLVSVHTLPLS